MRTEGNLLSSRAFVTTDAPCGTASSGDTRAHGKTEINRASRTPPYMAFTELDSQSAHQSHTQELSLVK